MKFDDIKKLHQKKYRAEFGRYLVEGEHLALELEKAAASNPALQSATLYVTESYQYWQSQFEKVIISERQMQQISDTKSPQGIIALVPMSTTSQAAPSINNTNEDTTNRYNRLRAIYLFETQDPGNLGTILRTLAWFGGFKCLLSPNSVDPYNPKVVRASMGAIFHLPIETDVSLHTLAMNYQRFASLDLEGEKLSSAAFKQQDCYIFGNEARGIPHQLLEDFKVKAFSIHGAGMGESLNLATAVNLCAYELSRVE